MENKETKNKRKTIIVVKENEEYSIDFINEVTKLSITAKKKSDIFSKIYSNSFSLQDIKKVRFFGEDYESIDDCLMEIFEKLDKNGTDENETKIEKNDSEVINIKVSKFSNRYPFIEFPLKIREKKDNEKISELENIVINLKKTQENEIKFLKDKIYNLENLLKIKNNQDYKKGLENFKGSYVEITCFGPNEIDNYFDLNQEYVYSKKGKKGFFISFVFTFKNERDAPSAIKSFKEIKEKYPNKDDIFVRIENNKVYIEINIHMKDFLNFFSIIPGQSLLVKTDAIPKYLFEDYDREKILKFILSTELQFKNLSTQIQAFLGGFCFLFCNVIRGREFLTKLIGDISLNAFNGNYKYIISKLLFDDEEKETKEIYNFFKQFLYDIIMDGFHIDYYKDYKKINFNEIEFNVISPMFKSGFNFKFILPFTNELVDEMVNKKIPSPKLNNNFEKEVEELKDFEGEKE